MDKSIHKNRIKSNPKAILYIKNDKNYYFKSISHTCRELNISKETLYKYLKIGEWKGGKIQTIGKIPENYEIINDKHDFKKIKIAMHTNDLVKMLKFYDIYCKNKNSDKSKEQFINDFVKCH